MIPQNFTETPEIGPEKKEIDQPAKAQKNSKSDPAPVFTHKENATIAQRIEILDWYHANGKNQSKTAKHFDPKYPNLRLKQPVISRWLTNESHWREQYEASGGALGTAKRVRQTQHPDISDMMDLWVLKAMGDGLLLTGEVLRQKWTQFADLVGVSADDRLELSNGWLEKFKKRNKLKEFKRHGEAASADPHAVDRERTRLRELLKKYGYPLRDIFNMDETGLFYG